MTTCTPLLYWSKLASFLRGTTAKECPSFASDYGVMRESVSFSGASVTTIYCCV